MKLRSYLTDLECDWVYFPWKSANLTAPNDGNVLVVGGGDNEAVMCILLSLVAANEVWNERYHIYFQNTNCEKVHEKIKKAISQNEISIFTSKNNFPIHYLIVVPPKIYNNDVVEAVNWAGFNELNLLFNNLEKKQILQAVLISDYRVYSLSNNKIFFSEGEIMSSDRGIVSAFYRELEQAFISLARKCHCQSATVLRVGYIMGGGFKNNPLQRFVLQIQQCDKLKVLIDHAIIPSIYAGDFLSAVFFVLFQKEDSFQIYNVNAIGGNITLADIAYCLEEIDCPHANLTFLSTPNHQKGIGLSSQKLQCKGWVPMIQPKEYILYAFAYFYNSTKEFIYTDYHKNYKLMQLQKVLLDGLVQIDSICKKNDIQYFLAGGTLLGAIRYKGFIPWDNDLDIMMTRENYSRFVAVIRNELPPSMFLQAKGNDPENHSYTKIRFNNTLLITPFNAQHCNLHNGVFIDVFPQDQTANAYIFQRAHIALTVIARSMVFHKWGRTSLSDHGSHRFIRGIFNIAKNCLSMHFLEAFQYKIIGAFENKVNCKFLFDGMGQNTKRGAFPKHWLEESEKTLFEGMEFPIPKYAQEYLTYLYGDDYIFPVPICKRKNEHDIILMDLGPYILEN